MKRLKTGLKDWKNDMIVSGMKLFTNFI